MIIIKYKIELYFLVIKRIFEFYIIIKGIKYNTTLNIMVKIEE